MNARHFPSEQEIQAFYVSPGWRRLSYETRKRYGFRCQCCGHSTDDGMKICADHIKPVRLYWDLRLDPENIQVLCEDCNLGKGSWDESDHRRKTVEALITIVTGKFTAHMDSASLMKGAIITQFSEGKIKQEEAIALIRDCGLKHA